MDKKVENNIRALRLQNGGMTQAELAEKIGATRQTVNAIEAAKYAPSLELAFKIADALNVPIDNVFYYQ